MPNKNTTVSKVQNKTKKKRLMPGNFPIRELAPYVPRWEIRARVTNKFPIKNFKSQLHEGNLFSVDLIDDEGYEIRANFFNASAAKFFNQIEEGRVYNFSEGTLKEANAQCNKLGHRYQIDFKIDAIKPILVN